MAHRQHWPISQEAGKSKGVGSVCHETRQLLLKDGTVHLHGPRHDRCDGSYKLPLSVLSTSGSLSQPAPDRSHSRGVSPSQTQSDVLFPGGSQSQPAGHQSSPGASDRPISTLSITGITASGPDSAHFINLSSAGVSVFAHLQLSRGTVKHIPRSARASCAPHLANLLRNVEATRCRTGRLCLALVRTFCST